MDELIRIAAITMLTMSPPHAGPAQIEPEPAPAVAWPGEDKFRHAAMSWATMAFTYAAARSADVDDGTALAIGAAVTAAAGIGKEVVDVRRGGPFSVGDLIADAVGIAAAWVVLREIH